jgi:hypothetical protein
MWGECRTVGLNAKDLRCLLGMARIQGEQKDSNPQRQHRREVVNIMMLLDCLQHCSSHAALGKGTLFMALSRHTRLRQSESQSMELPGPYKLSPQIGGEGQKFHYRAP